MKVGIIGYGWVGKAMKELFPEAMVYLRKITKDTPIDKTFTIDKEDINQCDVVFICVPTPVAYERELNTSMVEECIAWCKADLLVIRSTVNPGDTNRWIEKYAKKIVMQPEYLGETPNHPMSDQHTRQFLIIGGEPFNVRNLINLYSKVYNANTSIRQVTAYEAEVIKLTENRAIAFKVAQCQELYDVCQKTGVDYYTIRDAVYGDDPRFNLWWTLIYPDNRGMNSKCIPKDVYAWCAWAESSGYKPDITRAILERNKAWISQS